MNVYCSQHWIKKCKIHLFHVLMALKMKVNHAMVMLNSKYIATVPILRHYPSIIVLRPHYGSSLPALPNIAFEK